VALAADGPTGAAQDDRPELLVLRALGLGDLLTAVPALRGLRRGFPGHRIVLAAPAPLAELAAMTGAVDELRPTPGLTPPPVHPTRPDIAVNLHGRGPQSHTWLLAQRPGQLMAFTRPELDMPGPSWSADEPEVARWCRLLAAFGVACDPADLALADPARDVAGAGSVVVHPGAASGARRWPTERFAAVAAALAGDGVRPVTVTGGPGEEELARSVAAAAGCSISLGLGLTELAALVARAPLLVCGDTGLAHLATAMRTPSVLLFGPTSPQRWGPPPTPSAPSLHRVLWDGQAGDPHAAEPGSGLLAITVEQVLATARELLGTAQAA
jgi:ADP-heptose:LPS heptosyltransferase